MSVRSIDVIALATFVVTSLVAVLVLGNVFRSETCEAGWTGYVPIGTCGTTFWSSAYFVGPAIGFLVSASVLWRRRTAR
jgi:hypothetical protein